MNKNIKYSQNFNIKYSQNFLTSEKVLNQIIKQLNLKETDTVYEIGTGKGHLTTKLAKISKQVTSIELDSHLFNLSSEKLKLNTRVTLIHQDILQFQFPNKQRYKIVGSIPYHLSTQIILKSATKLFSVLLASKRPLITELADKLRLKYPLLPTISPCPTMRLEAIRSIIPISCRRYPKSV